MRRLHLRWTTAIVAVAIAAATAWSASPAPVGALPSNEPIVPVVPTRLLDTRDGTGAPAAKVAPGGTVELTVTGGTNNVPNDAAAVALNVTITDATNNGYVTVWPCGLTRPTASNLNVTQGGTIPNLVIAKIGVGGKVCLFSQNGGHLIADLNAWYPAESGLISLQPARLLDTRNGTGAPAAKVAPGGTVELTVTGGTNNVPNDAAAVALNVTITDATNNGFVTVWPCGQPRPTASNLNVTQGGTIPNLVIAKIGTAGKVCLFSQTGGHLIADLNGFWGAINTGAPISDVVVIGPSAPGGAGAPIGFAPVTGLPLLNPTLAGAANEPVGAPVAASRPSDAPPLTAELAELILGSGPIPPTPLATFSPPTPDGLVSTQLFGEPAFPFVGDYIVDPLDLDPAIGRLFTWQFDGVSWSVVGSCTATVAGPNMVLTAANCLEGNDGFSFQPGLLGASKPYGTFVASSATAFVDPAFASWNLQSEAAAILVDYGFVRFDPVDNNGRNLSVEVPPFQIFMTNALSGAPVQTIGYPAAGFYETYCSFQSCWPYWCSSTGDGNADYGSGWNAIGFGCDANGGMSGAPVFAQIGGTWYIVGVFTNGGYLIDANGFECFVAGCAWYMLNGWGPEFRNGWLDELWLAARNG